MRPLTMQYEEVSSFRGPENSAVASVRTEASETPRPSRTTTGSCFPRELEEPRWQLGFFGVVAYFIIEYTQLPLQYPVLQPLALGKVAALLALAGWLILPPKEPYERVDSKGADKTFLVLLLAVLASTVFAPYQREAWNALIDAVRWGVIYFIISRLVDNAWRLRTVCFVWLLLSLKMGQFVCRTYATYRAAGVDEMVLVGHGVGGTGFFANAADMGVGMCVIWPVAVCLLFSKPKGIYRLVIAAAAVACLGAIFLCGSRGAVVGAVAIGLAAMIKNPKKIAACLMIALLGIAIWFVLPEATKQRFQSARNPEQDQTVHHRQVLWRAGIHMWKDNPILGVGPGNFPKVRWSRYPIEVNNQVVSVTHDLYIQGLSELGLLGMTPMVILWITFFRLNAATRRKLLSLGLEQRQSFEFCLATGLDLGFIGYLTSGIFVSVLWYPHIFVLLGLSVALYNVARRKESPEEAAQAPPGGVKPLPARTW